MTVTDIDAMLKHLEDHPDDWTCRLVLADAYEDEGDDLRSAYYRWSSKNHKHPELFKVEGGMYEWWWDEVKHGCQNPAAKIGPDGFFGEMQDYLCDEHQIEDYRSEDLATTEYHLALFLRHKGEI